jgi:hypothetical protein
MIPAVVLLKPLMAAAWEWVRQNVEYKMVVKEGARKDGEIRGCSGWFVRKAGQRSAFIRLRLSLGLITIR